jgi:uncharacterized protein
MPNSKNEEKAAPEYKVCSQKNVYVAMRDGVKLACDIYRPDSDGKFPALLAMSPYGKEGQVQKIPPRPFNPEYAHLEAGNTEFLVSHGYVHVIADVRGSGHSEGQYDVCSR